MVQNRQCRALALDARNAAIWTKSGEKIYHGTRPVGNSLPLTFMSTYSWNLVLFRKHFSEFFFRFRIRIMIRIRISLWNSLEKVILYMWRDPRKGTYDPKNRFSDYTWFCKFFNWSFMGSNQKFFIYIILGDINYWEKSLNAFRAAAVSSIARRVNFHFWIVGPFSRIASHILKISIKFGVAPQSFCENQNSVQDQDHDFTLDFNTRPTFHT